MGKVFDALKDRIPRQYTPNQLVALNVVRARALRGWTQEEASAALAPYLGTRWSNASFSAIERSTKGTRVKQFSADELVAMARGFRVPLGWFFTPPPAAERAWLYTADRKNPGIDFGELLDVVLGTPDTLPEWAEALEAWAAEKAAVDAHDVAPPKRGRRSGVVAGRVAEQAEVRARALLRRRFGDLGEAKDVLRRLAELIEDLDEAAGDASADGAPGTEGERPS